MSGAKVRPVTERKRSVLAAAGFLIVGSSSYFALLLGVLRSILVMRLIGPMPQGVRRTVDLALKYLTHCHLGILHGLNKELPLRLGKKDYVGAEAVEEAGVSWIVGLTLLASLGMLGVGLANPTGHHMTALALIIGAGLLAVNQTYMLYRTMARVWGHFGALGIAGVVETMASLAFTLGGAYGFYHWGPPGERAEYGMLGAMLGGLSGSCLALGLIGQLAPIRVRIRFDVAIAGRLIKTGVPIAAFIFADTLLRTVDGVILTRAHGAYWFGLYSIAMQLSGYLFTVAETAGFVLWPRIMEAFGAAGSEIRALRRQILLPTQLLGYFMPFLAGFAYILLPPVIRLILPKFVDGIAATRVLCLGTVLLALPMATNSLMIARDWHVRVVGYKLIGAGVAGGACLWLARAPRPELSAFALAASGGYAVAALLSFATILPYYAETPVQRMALWGSVLGPLVWTCGALWSTARLIEFWGVAVGGELGRTVAELVCFCGLMAPLLAYGNRQTGLWREMRRVYQSWRGASRKGEEQEHEGES